MSALELHSFLSKRPPVISDSARQLSYRFGVAVTTVTSNLQKAGYVQTSLGYELPSEERPVTVTLNLEDVKQVLTELIQPSTPSIVKFTNEQKLKVLESGKTVDEAYDLLKQTVLKTPVEPSKIFKLSLALYILSNPELETY